MISSQSDNKKVTNKLPEKKGISCSTVASCFIVLVAVAIILFAILGLSDSSGSRNSNTSQQTGDIKFTEYKEDSSLDKKEEVEGVNEEDVSQEEDVKSVEEVKEEVVEKVKEETPQSLEDRVRDYVIDELGEETNMSEDTVRDIVIDPSGVTIEINTNDNFTEKMIKRGIRADIMDIFGSSYSFSYEDGIFQLDESISKVNVLAYMMGLDIKGNEIESIQMTVIFTRATYETINWENFNFDNLYYVADNYFEGNYLSGISY